VAAIGGGDAFTKGRDFAAWLGLVPRQISTGDRTILGKISKRAIATCGSCSCRRHERKRCELAGGNLKQKARSQWLPARTLIARSSAAISRRRSIACAV
jgi:transposase